MYLRPSKMQNITALLIDLDGVLYEADEPVPGAAAAIQWLRDGRGVRFPGSRSH